MEMVLKSAAKRSRHGIWGCFCAKNQKRASAEEIMAKSGRVISREEGDNGVVRVRIVMSKNELKRIMAASLKSEVDGVDGGAGRCRMATTTSAALAAQNLEQSLHALRQRHMINRVRSMNDEVSHGGWTPALQSIPEEIL